VCEHFKTEDLFTQTFWDHSHINLVKVNISQTYFHLDVDDIDLDYEDGAGGRNVGVNQTVEGIII
jgi:hypothetical protein